MDEASRNALPALAQGDALAETAPGGALDDRIVRLLSERPPTSSAGLTEALGVPLRTVQYRLGRLAGTGTVAQPKRGVWELTAAGRRAALAVRAPSLAPLDAHDVLAMLPPWHAAMARLALGAAITRRALAGAHPTQWPAFIAVGRTKTGKTLIGQVVCRVLGLDPAEHVRLLSFETAGSVAIRRRQREGGEFEATLARLLGEPFVVFDELDKAPPGVRRAVGAVLLGQSVVDVEGTRLEVCATPLVTLNDDRGRERLLSEALIRRSVVLNTRAPALRAAARDLDEIAHDIDRRAIRPLPADVVPPAGELPVRARNALRALLMASLSELGRDHVDIEPLARIALGYWALDIETGPELAAARVALDYLLCTSTCEAELRDDWDACFANTASTRLSDERLHAALEVLRTERQGARAAQVAERERERSDALALTARRTELLALIDSAVRSAPRRLSDGERLVRAGAVAKSRTLATWTREASSLDELAGLLLRVEVEVVGPLRQLVATHEAAAESARRERAAQAERRRRDREKRREVERYVADLRRLSRRRHTKPGEDVLGMLIELGCVIERSESYVVEVEPSMWERAADAVAGVARTLWRGDEPGRPAPGQLSDPYGLGLNILLPVSPAPTARSASDERPRRYERRVRTWYEDHAGRAASAAELRAWSSPAVRAALDAAAARFRRARV